VFVLVVAWIAWTAIRIWTFNPEAPDHADAAIVLGASTWDSKPSPVYQERINHGIALYESGRVAKLIFSGGTGKGEKISLAEAAGEYALQKGIPEQDIILEPYSRITKENLALAGEVARAEGLETFLIVSDPLHLKRALRMAQDQGIRAWGSPTPTTKYRGMRKQLWFLRRETYFYIQYLLVTRYIPPPTLEEVKERERDAPPVELGAPSVRYMNENGLTNPIGAGVVLDRHDSHYTAFGHKLITERIAHRGFSAAYPENTVAAITNAWRAGASIVEIDVRMTVDGVPVLCHDVALNDTRIDATTHREVRCQGVAGLRDVLPLVPSTAKLLIDLKDDSPAFISAVGSCIADFPGKTKRIIFQSRSFTALERMAKQFPASRYYYVTSLQREGATQQPPSAAWLAESLAKRELDGVTAKGRRFIDRQYVAEFQRRGLEFFVWTINEADRIAHYHRLGVDGIISDHPDLVHNVLNSN